MSDETKDELKNIKKELIHKVQKKQNASKDSIAAQELAEKKRKEIAGDSFL
jgi:hypothetical protein